MSERSLERRLFWSFVAADAAILFSLPVVPGHDLPQHLAYVRLLLGWTDPSLGLDRTYEAFDGADAYCTTYRELAALARGIGLDGALRLVLVGYVVVLALGLAWLARASFRLCWRQPCATALLGPALAWNPVVCMGFLPFQLALAPMVVGAAALVDFAQSGRRWALAAFATAAVVTIRLHMVAGLALLALAALLAVARRDGRTMAAAALGAVLIAVGIAMSAGAHVSRPDLPGLVVRNARTYGFFDGLVGTFIVSFSHWTTKANMLLANPCGPFPRWAQAVTAAAIAVVVTLVVRARRRAAPPARGVRPAVAGFALLSVAAPAAIQVPDDICLLDFRLMTIAMLFSVAVIPPAQLSTAAPRRALAAFAALSIGLWALLLRGTAMEAAAAVHLVERLGPRDRLLALPLHDASAHLDSSNAVLHYAPMFHTVLNAGTTSLFWGRYTPRLPIGYRPGAEPAHPHDWHPELFRDEHLAGWSHVIVGFPDEDDSDEARAAAERVRRMRGDRLREVGCDGRWCLYEISAREELASPTPTPTHEDD